MSASSQQALIKNYIMFNNLVKSFLDYLKKEYSTHSKDFEVFDTYFRLIVHQVTFPLRNYRAITKPFYERIMAKDESYFLQFSTEGLFESVHLKDLYLQSSEAQKEYLWTYVQNLTKLAHEAA